MAYTNVTGSQKFKSTGDVQSSDRVWGAILAAGSSSRFGTVKALAGCGGLTVIEHVANTLMHGGCQSTFAVVGKPHSTRICQQVPRLRVQPVAEEASPSMLTSFLTALEFARVQGVKTVVVALLDQPHVQPATIASLLTALGNPPPWLEASGGAKWVVPRYLGRCGHPFAVHLDRIGVVRMDRKPPITLRDALHRWGDRVEVDVPDPGVLDDLDTLEDAARLGISPMASLGYLAKMTSRPFNILGVQQIAIGAEDRTELRTLWVELLGFDSKGTFRSDSENVDEEILALGHAPNALEIDLMQPIDPGKKPRVDSPALNHVGFWVDDLRRAVEWLTERGVRFAPGGIRKGAAGYDVCFIHPKPSSEQPVSGHGVLIELVQAPDELRAQLEAE